MSANKSETFIFIYGGKICAALDRQHPRDLFDIKILLENEGLTDEIRKAFIVYLISHPRPMVELLNPNFKDLSQIFYTEFQGMTTSRITLDELLPIRKKLVNWIKESLTKDERRFIISIKRGEPEWDLFEIGHVKDLPAVKWKLYNTKRMDDRKHRQALVKLRRYLGLFLP